MVERDPIFGYCVECVLPEQAFKKLEDSGEVSVAKAEKSTQMLCALGQLSTLNDCQGTRIVINEGHIQEICGMDIGFSALGI